MREFVRILLLDSNPESGLAKALQEIIESSLDVNIQVQEDSTGVFGPPLFEGELSCLISQFSPDIMFLVLSPSHLEQTDTLLQYVKRETPNLPIIAVIEECKPDEIFALLEYGAVDFITPPFTVIDVLPRVWRILDHMLWKETLVHALKEKLGLEQLIGSAPTFLEATNRIALVARCDASVLISGETGTGKELCARAIHYLSPRTSKPFVPVTCGAIPTDLMENELFGHVRGAFTGASSSQQGLIKEADGGTLFLDDVDCLPFSAQAKLLRLIQEKEYRQLGSAKMQRADVRIIAATNLDLEEAVTQGKFRQDLYYRLNIIPLRLPPLRERREDIPLLARHFLAKYAAEFNKRVAEFSPEAVQMLTLYDWPGNVRELEYVVERAVVLSEQPVIRGPNIVLPRTRGTGAQQSFKEAKSKTITQFERSYIQGLLAAHQGNITKAANAAQKNRRAFWQLIRKHRIDAQRFKAG
ncbi:AAA domain-containing protein [Candidatus Saccharibacteria bacterium]|nr:AAA domain-containing protein [candidate division Zixibacteria bacterium]NIT03927.1 AAA domain-containing protein [Candidatus Saccharibacteria bacterium]